MKTFTILAILGVASAIHLGEDQEGAGHGEEVNRVDLTLESVPAEVCEKVNELVDDNFPGWNDDDWWSVIDGKVPDEVTPHAFCLYYWACDAVDQCKETDDPDWCLAAVTELPEYCGEPDVPVAPDGEQLAQYEFNAEEYLHHEQRPLYFGYSFTGQYS